MRRALFLAALGVGVLALRHRALRWGATPAEAQERTSALLVTGGRETGPPALARGRPAGPRPLTKRQLRQELSILCVPWWTADHHQYVGVSAVMLRRGEVSHSRSEPAAQGECA